MAEVLASGDSRTEQLNPGNWKWYEMDLEENRTYYNAVVPAAAASNPIGRLCAQHLSSGC